MEAGSFTLSCAEFAWLRIWHMDLIFVNATTVACIICIFHCSTMTHCLLQSCHVSRMDYMEIWLVVVSNGGVVAIFQQIHNVKRGLEVFFQCFPYLLQSQHVKGSIHYGTAAFHYLLY